MPQPQGIVELHLLHANAAQDRQGPGKDAEVRVEPAGLGFGRIVEASLGERGTEKHGQDAQRETCSDHDFSS